MAKHCVNTAEKLAQFHKMKIEENQNPSLFKTINKWIDNIKGFEWTDEKKKQQFSELNFEKIEEFVSTIQRDVFSKKDTRVVDPTKLEDVLDLFSVGFCHNDLLALNVLYNDLDGSIHFIDYEYCGYNFRAFDIGNHFDEYAGFDLNPSNYPSIETQIKFLTKYLETLYEGPSSDITADMVEKYRHGILLFSCLGSVFWGLWGICQANFSDIDFDYLKYAKQRFDWFWTDLQKVRLEEL